VRESASRQLVERRVFFIYFPVQVEETEQESNRSGLLGYTESFCPEDPN
jgi:hypothetical protein